MLVELSPIFDVFLHLHTLINVDLIQRGFYQIRTRLRVSSSSSSIINVHMPRSQLPTVYPAAVIDGMAVSRTVELIYADDACPLDDVIRFRIHVPIRADKLPAVQLLMHLELWYIEQDMMTTSVSPPFRCVSARTLRFSVRTDRCLVHHRPILFDYFHLAAVSFSLYASLVSFDARHKTTSGATTPNSQPISDKLHQYHRSICRLLLSAHESIQSKISKYASLFDDIVDNLEIVNVDKRLQQLCDDMVGNEFDGWKIFEIHRNLLGQQLIDAFNRFIDLFKASTAVRHLLAVEQHHGRVKRFAEGFFCSEDSMHSLIVTGMNANHTAQQSSMHARIVDMLKRSAYFNALPALVIACDDIDGVCETIPIIFEMRHMSSFNASTRQSRLPSISEPDQHHRSSRRGSRFSPEKMARLLKSSLCLELRHLNTPANDDDDVYLVASKSSTINDTIDDNQQHNHLVVRNHSNISSPGGNVSPAPSLTYPMLMPSEMQRCGSLPNFTDSRCPDDDAASWQQDELLPRVRSTTGIIASVPDNIPSQKDCSSKVDPISPTNDDVVESEDLDADCPLITVEVSDDYHNLSSTIQIDDSILEFVRNKEHFKEKLSLSGYSGHLYSDFAQFASRLPYFSQSTSTSSRSLVHLIVCLHGLDGSVDDLRPYRTFIRLMLPEHRLTFLMSESNQIDTFGDLNQLAENLVNELLTHLDGFRSIPDRISYYFSFIAHSLGTLIVRSALVDTRLSHIVDRLHCFLSLNGPHCGLLYNQRAANWGITLVQWWKQSRCLEQLTLKDCSDDQRSSFLYRLSQNSAFASFRYVLLVGSSHDLYVPCHSALIQMCKEATKDTTGIGIIYHEMIANMIESMVASNRRTSIIRYVAYHGMAHASRTHQLMGRAAHVAVLDDDLFVEKLLAVSAIKYFQ